MNTQLSEINPVSGIRLGVAAAGIKETTQRNDIALIELVAGGNAAGVFTSNAFRAAPIILAQQHLNTKLPRYLLINSGNANAGTGKQGIQDAYACCQALASIVGCTPEEVLPFSTGIIGEPLPVTQIVAALPNAVNTLSGTGWLDAAQAIMTTDTVPKYITQNFQVGKHTAVITGMAKGSGMICPNMGTMLAYIATDLAVLPPVLQQILHIAVAQSFNCISVDGDTSTNDACILLASGKNSAPTIYDPTSSAGLALASAVNAVCKELAEAIVRDGEGATKLVHIKVHEALNRNEARQVADTIAHSPLVKTALFASDPNWGRILAAVGRVGLENLDIDLVRLYLDDVCIVRNGCRAAEYTEKAGQEVLQRSEFTIKVALGRGNATANLLTCDLSHDYVRINAEYRT